jgi:hypothetical protein
MGSGVGTEKWESKISEVRIELGLLARGDDLCAIHSRIGGITVMADNTSRPSGLRAIPARKLALSLILPLIGFAVVWFIFMRPMQERRKLRDTGIRVPGMILDVEATNTRINKSPELELTVEYRRRDGLLDTGKTLFVPTRSMIRRYYPGVAVIVAYDSTQPTHFTIAGFDEHGE